MKKVSNNKIAQQQFNSKTVYNKHRTSSHVSFVTITNTQGTWSTQTNKQINSPGGFRAESKTVLGEYRAPGVEASQGFDCPGFIQPNKQTNKPKIWRILR